MAAVRLVGVFVVAVCGCNTPTYLTEHRPLETRAGAMGGGYNPDTDLYVLPVRRPSTDERSALSDEQRSRGLKLPVPWAGERDFAIEIEWSAKNLDTQTVTAFFTLNGGNEFGDYVPSLYVDPNAAANQQNPPPPLLGGSPIVLDQGQTQLGVFREDQLDEAGLDLEAITRYPSMAGVRATPFEVVAHDSSASRIGLDGIPANDVTPAMVRYQFGLSADGHVVVDYTVRVRDRSGDGKLAQPTDKNLYVSTAAMLAPPATPPATMTAP